MMTWSPPSKLAMTISFLIMFIGLLLDVLISLSFFELLPTEIPIISDYPLNLYIMLASWALIIIAWLIILIAVKTRGF